MHILLIHQAFASITEPGGTRHDEFAHHLAQSGHRVTVLTGRVNYLTGELVPGGSRPSLSPRSAGVDVRRCYAYPAWHRSFFHRTLSFLSFTLSSFLVGIRVGSVDLVWGTSPPIFQALTAWSLARIKRAAFLLEVRDLWPEFAVAVGVLRQPLLIRLAEGLERLLYRRADCVVVNSPGYLEPVRSRGAATVELVPNGVESAMFDPEDGGEDFRATHALGDRFVVMYAGAHGMSNDLGVVLQAANRLKGRPEIRFVLVGDGKEKPALIELAERMNLSNVIFAPPVPKREIPGALAAADACLAILKPIPAYRTTYPNKVFDYMAAGRPVLLAIDGVMREVVEKAEAGIFVPPGDPKALAESVRALADDPERGRKMGLAGHAYVAAHFDRAKLAESMRLVLERTSRRGTAADHSPQGGARNVRDA